MSSRSVLAAVAFVTLASCSSGTDESSSSPSTSKTPSSVTTSTLATTTTTVDEKEKVKQAYLAYWAMLDRLGQAPNPDDPELVELVTEPALSDIVEQIRTRVENGQRTVLNGPELDKHELMSVVVRGDGASVTDCFVDGRSVVDSNGTIVDDDIVTKSLVAEFVRQSPRWRLRTIDIAAEKPGVGSCDA